jgi:hypothetical protein
MDYEKYYKDQINEPVFRGVVFQKGHGFGDVFKKFFRWIVPIVKQHATPIASTLGKEALKSAVNIATDTLDGKKLSESSKDRLKESLANISTKYGSGKRKRPKKILKAKKQYKKATKRKIKSKTKKIKKRKLDIFD